MTCTTEKEKFEKGHTPMIVYEEQRQMLSVLLIYSLITLYAKTKEQDKQYFCLACHH